VFNVIGSVLEVSAVDELDLRRFRCGRGRTMAAGSYEHGDEAGSLKCNATMLILESVS